MSNINYKLIAGFLVGVLLGVFLFSSLNKKEETVITGSVVQGNEYNSTTTSPTFTVAPGFKVLKENSGSLGSLVVTVAGTGTINIYDATTTTNGAIYGTTTIAKLNTALTGTFTYDVVFNKGLLIETVGSNTGTTTITWR